MLPANLTPVEVFDLGIQGELLAFRMYEALIRRIQVPTVQTRLNQLKRDEKEHRKTLRAHRRALFPDEGPTISEQDAERVFGKVDLASIRDKDSLIQALYGAIRFEEYGSYFYDKTQFKVASPEARIFMEVLANEGRTHASILKQQIEAVRLMEVHVDDRGRAVEVP